MKIRTKGKISLSVGLLVIVVTIVSPPFNPASARPDPSTLHDYSFNVGVADLFPNTTPTFSIKVFSNADVFMVNPKILEKKLHFDVQGPVKSQQDAANLDNGYFEITIPHVLLGGEYSVLINNATITNYNMTYNHPTLNANDQKKDDSTTIAFNYDGTTTKSIDILGTTAIPEFPINGIAVTASIVAIFIVVIIFTKRSHFARIQ